MVLDYLKKELMRKFRNLIYDLCLKFPLLHLIISELCELEVKINAYKIDGFIDELMTCDVGIGMTGQSQAMLDIPKDTFYCQGCKYSTYSKLARFFFGSQCDGYCYYLGRGDFSLLHPTDLLWDGCKECCINEDIEEDS